jgi:hypothetical protein
LSECFFTHVVNPIRFTVKVLVCHLLQFLFEVLERFVFIIGTLDIGTDLFELFDFILGL